MKGSPCELFSRDCRSMPPSRTVSSFFTRTIERKLRVVVPGGASFSVRSVNSLCDRSIVIVIWPSSLT